MWDVDIPDWFIEVIKIAIPTSLSIYAIKISKSSGKISKKHLDEAKKSNNEAETANEKAETANRLADEANRLTEKAREDAHSAVLESKEANRLTNEANKILNESHNLAKSESYSKNRPELLSFSLITIPKEIEPYIDSKIGYDEWNAKDIYDYKNELTNTPKGMARLSHKGKEYLFINMRPLDVKLDKMILVFGIIHMVLEFKNIDKIGRLTIEKAYSVLDDGEKIIHSFYTDMKIKWRFPNSSKIQIPIALAYKNLDATPVHAPQIIELEKTEEEINLTNSISMANKYLNFTETAYLLKCVTKDGIPYDYSIFLEKDELPLIEYSKKLFLEKAEQANRSVNYDVVAHSIGI